MKYIWIAIGFLILIIGISSLILPDDYVIERSVIVNQDRFVVFNKIRLLKSHKQWNPWVKKDPSIVYDFKGVDGTEGFISHWVGINKIGIGEGEQEIKKILEGERIDYEIRFKSPLKITSYSSLTTTEEGDSKTKVTWRVTGDLKFPLDIFFKFSKMRETLEFDFEEGTNVLKAILEKDL